MADDEMTPRAFGSQRQPSSLGKLLAEAKMLALQIRDDEQDAIARERAEESSEILRQSDTTAG